MSNITDAGGGQSLAKTIKSVQLHVAQQIEGAVRGFVSAEDKHYKVALTLTELGVLIQGKKTNKLVPFTNIQGIDFGKAEESC
jgi:hypothetical protein